MKITIAHTPDPDDSFMFYAMLENKIETNYDYSQVVKDIETLNLEAPAEKYDVTAISANGFSHVSDRYYLLSSGASFDISYGPLVVAKKHVDLGHAVLGVPGLKTSAYLLYRMFGPTPNKFVEVRFDEIPERILSGQIDAGILIHDEQLVFQNKGLVEVLNLYSKWREYAGDLPIPLGFNAIRKSLGKEVAAKYNEDFANSIKYAVDHEDEAVDYAMRYARYSNHDLEKKFIRMYVNDLSVDFGPAGRKALEKYYGRAVSMGIIKDFSYEII